MRVVDRSGPAVVLHWSSVSNRYYRIVRSANLSAGWSPTATHIRGTPPVNTGEVPRATAPEFYRIEVDPED
jgi:hypothetical protein